MNETALLGFQAGEIISALFAVTTVIVILVAGTLLVRGALR